MVVPPILPALRRATATSLRRRCWGPGFRLIEHLEQLHYLRARGIRRAGSITPTTS